MGLGEWASKGIRGSFGGVGRDKKKGGEARMGEGGENAQRSYIWLSLLWDIRARNSFRGLWEICRSYFVQLGVDARISAMLFERKKSRGEAY